MGGKLRRKSRNNVGQYQNMSSLVWSSMYGMLGLQWHWPKRNWKNKYQAWENRPEERLNFEDYPEGKFWGLGSGRAKCVYLGLVLIWLYSGFLVFFGTGLQAVPEGIKKCGLRWGNWQDSHWRKASLKLSETQGRFLVPEGSLFANKNVRRGGPWKWRKWVSNVI